MFRNVLLYFLCHKKLELNQKHNDHCGISQESDNQKCPKIIKKNFILPNGNYHRIISRGIHGLWYILRKE